MAIGSSVVETADAASSVTSAYPGVGARRRRPGIPIYVAPRLLLAILCAGVIGATVVVTRGIPDIDSGEFAYVAQIILHGGVPYRDVWDHKPPAIYYIDALGLLLGLKIQGIWVVEWLSCLLAALGSLDTLRRSFGSAVGLVASALWLLALIPLLGGGNFTEEYGLAFGFGALWAFDKVWRHGQHHFRWSFATGVMCALEVLCKPTGIGIFFAILIYLGLSLPTLQRRTVPRIALALVAGFLVPVLVTVASFMAQHALPALIDQVIRYNLIYAHSSMPDKIISALVCLFGLSLTGLAPLAGLSWLHAMRRLTVGAWLGRKGGAPWSEVPPVVRVAAIGLPIEVVLAALDGRVYMHNYMLALPACAVMAAYGLHLLCRMRRRDLARALFLVLPLLVLWTGVTTFAGHAVFPRLPVSVAALPTGLPLLIAMLLTSKKTHAGRRVARVWRGDTRLALVLLASLCLCYMGAVYQIESFRILGRGLDTAPIATYIRAHTTSQDSILVWGADSYLYVDSGRSAPTRYAYQYGLYTRGYADAGLVRDFVDDLEAHPPRIIVESNMLDRCVTPLDRVAVPNWTIGEGCAVLPTMSSLVRYISMHYHAVPLSACSSVMHCAIYVLRRPAGHAMAMRQHRRSV